MNRWLSLSGIFLICSLLLFACQKEYSLELGKITNTLAEGSLYDTATANCLPSQVHGTYYTGVATGDTNYVAITVNVTAPGNYRIETDSVNGLSFFDSGYFSTTGYDTIRLKAFGKPVNVGLADFTVIFDSSICGFTINVLDSTGTGLGTDTSGNGNGGETPTGIDTATAAKDSWKFTDSTSNTSYDGPILLANLQLGTGSFIMISGTTLSSEILILSIMLPNNQVTIGKYPLGNGTYFSFSTAMTDPIFNADGSSGTADDSYITINTYDATTKLITGNFRGWAKDADGNDIYITNGAYNATFP
jgi:hypothetical protein